MKQNHKLLTRIISIALILIISLFPVTVSASQITAKDIADQVIRFEKSTFESFQSADDKAEWLTETLMNPDTSLGDTYASWLATIIKITANTVNPKNEEQYRIPASIVKGNNNSPVLPQKRNNDYSIFTVNLEQESSVLPISPLFSYFDDNGNLIIWGTRNNRTGHTLKVDGIDWISFRYRDGKVFASGEANTFDQPMIYAKRDESTRINVGVIDGYPTGSFVKFVFEPGSYDPNIDIGSIDDVDVEYSLVYSYLD